MKHDEGEDKETQGEDSSANGAEAICPFSLSFLDGQILKCIHIVPE